MLNLEILKFENYKNSMIYFIADYVKEEKLIK